MDLSRPYSAVAPSVDGDVLVALSRTTHPLTGRGVARRVPNRSVAGVADALDRLVRQGLVTRLEAPPAALHTLNRQHVAAPIADALAGIRTEFVDRLRAMFSTWEMPVVHASLFGSAARADGGIDSDIDVFVVRPVGVSDEDAIWDWQLATLSGAIFEATGNEASIIDFAEQDISRMLDDKPLVLQDLQRDGINLAGVSLQKLLRSAK